MPSSARPYALSAYDLGRVMLRPVTEADALALGAGLAAIEPWRRLNYADKALSDSLTRPDPAICRLAIYEGGNLSGVVAVREPWLRGPYLELLGLLPPAQGRGIGSLILKWFEAEASARARNLWVLCSDFNTGALAFYERHGFVRMTAIESLVGEGFSEILLRKKLNRT
jgi:GNAT superfamily N-acetyltransferase